MASEKHLEELQKIIDFVESNLTSEMTVADVCSQGAFSVWEVQRLFRAYTGDTVGSYIRGRRLTKSAQKLLAKDGSNVLDIAIEFQFGSQEAFTRAFKTQFGVAPGQMRREGSTRLAATKPKLNSSRLTYIAKKISKTPEIKIIPARTLLGRPIMIDSTLGSEKESYDIVRKQWIEFFKLIPGTPRKNAYGLIFGSDQSMNDERLTYATSVEFDSLLRNEDIDLQQYEISEQLYAIFEMESQEESCHFIADYIYGIWLPQSDYRRAEGYDFELLNCENPEARGAIRYHIPVKRKPST